MASAVNTSWSYLVDTISLLVTLTAFTLHQTQFSDPPLLKKVGLPVCMVTSARKGFIFLRSVEGYFIFPGGINRTGTGYINVAQITNVCTRIRVRSSCRT